MTQYALLLFLPLGLLGILSSWFWVAAKNADGLERTVRLEQASNLCLLGVGLYLIFLWCIKQFSPVL